MLGMVAACHPSSAPMGSNTHLQGVDWRPGTACSEGLIVGSDNGTSWSPTFGLIIRFTDINDPDC